MARTPTHYDVLHVQRDAPHEIIHMSYLTLMRRLRMHPDLGGDPDTAARINEAFAVLNDPEARARYDRALAAAARGPEPAVVLLPLPGEARRPTAAAPVTTCEFCGTLHPATDLERPSATCTLCGSSLYPALMHEQDDTARRAFHRISREWPLAFHLSYPYGAPLTGTTRDLSISGLRFTTAHRLACDDRLRIICAFCDALGIVRHVQQSREYPDEPWSVGVAFSTLRVTLAPGGIISTLI